MEAKKKSWTSALFAYAEGEKKQLVLSVILSVLSVMLGLVPFYCMYALICLFVAGTATAALAVKWCLLALLAYAVKIALSACPPAPPTPWPIPFWRVCGCGWPTASFTRLWATWRTTPSARSRA